MPSELLLQSNAVLLDTMGRKNRKWPDRECLKCGNPFRPLRASSRYCSRPCAWANNGKHQTRLSEVWWTNQKGYIEGRVTDQGTTRRVKKHRLIMEKHLGRRLEAWEDVHHKDEVKTNNEIDNLQIKSHGEHTRDHFKGRAGNNKGRRLNLSDAERQARSERMRQRHQARKAIALVDGEQTK